MFPLFWQFRFGSSYSSKVFDLILEAEVIHICSRICSGPLSVHIKLILIYI
jgi:hypothetical protein